MIYCKIRRRNATGEPYFTTVEAGGNKCVYDAWVNVAEDRLMASWIGRIISSF